MGKVKKGEEESVTIEEIFEKLDGIIKKLEAGDVSLEDSFDYYEAGIKLVKSCSQKLDRVEKQILVLNGDSGQEIEGM